MLSSKAIHIILHQSNLSDLFGYRFVYNCCPFQTTGSFTSLWSQLLCFNAYLNIIKFQNNNSLELHHTICIGYQDVKATEVYQDEIILSSLLKQILIPQLYSFHCYDDEKTYRILYPLECDLIPKFHLSSCHFTC